jgi:hypothetical protein
MGLTETKASIAAKINRGVTFLVAVMRALGQQLRGIKFPRAEVWLSLFTLALVLETGISLGILNQTDTALHRTAQAAKNANETNVAIQRATIVPTTTEISFFGEVSQGQKIWQVAPVWINSGGTISPSVKMLSLTGTFDASDTVPPLPDVLRSRKVIDFFLGPKERSYATGINLPASVMNLIANRKLDAQIFGVVAYSDIFKGRHITMSCQLLDLPNIDFNSVVFTQPASLGVTRRCDKYNCTDDQCAGYKGTTPIPLDFFP